ncbi:MAG TPA: prepilin-type N-terminal cleavage/methylation domain-containing protein [Stellaceae bacterium]
MPDRDTGSGGFSLIEVLAALVVIGLALAVAGGVFRTGLLGHEVAVGSDGALALAEEKIASVGVTEPLRPGRSVGLFGSRFQWQVSIEPYQEKSGTDFDQPASDLQLYRIAVTVSWRDGRRQRALALDTLRLGPPPP